MYRVERYVAEAVRSVLEQTFGGFELILVDDGSPDDSVAVCRRFDDPRIRLVRQANRGLAGARNAGIRAARGAFVAFLDADDRWMPQKLERHLDHLSAHPGVGLSFSHSALIDDDGRPLGRYQSPPGGPVSPEVLLMDNPVGNGSTPVARRAALEALAYTADGPDGPERCYFDPALRRVEDLDCWLRLALTTPWQVACLPEVLTCYRINPAGLSANGQAMRAAWEHVVAKARVYAPGRLARAERPARARLLRYLASRAVQARQPAEALALLSEALRADPALLWQQPRPTWLTLAAAAALRTLPAPAFGRLEHLARRAA